MNQIQLDFKPLIKKLELLTNKFVESEYTGEAFTKEKRKGLEFEDFKQFTPGDDASMIDWKASLRMGQLLMRQYTQMKTQYIFIVMDVSNSMLYSSIPKLKCEYAAELAAAMSYYFLKNDDVVGLTLFNDHVASYIPPSFGTKHFSAITKTLGTPKLYGGNFDLTKTISHMQKFVRRGAAVILISDFIGLQKNWHRPLYALSAKADMMALIVRDPEDMNLNKQIGRAVIEDPYTGDAVIVDTDKMRRHYAIESKKHLEETRIVLEKGKIDSLLLETNKPFADPLVRFFARRKSKWQ